MPTSDLIVSDLRKEYPTPTQPLVVLKSVNLKLSPGERLAIVGPSGSGKSTLLNILGTLDTPSGGAVRLADVDPFSLDPKELAKFRSRSIGFIFQDHHLLPQCTALENVLLPRLALSKTTDDDHRRAVELLGQVGLADRVTHLPAELSGGERQRVAIARALMNQPKVLFADEPTGNLDAETGGQIMAVLENLHRTRGQTIVMVTHDRAVARKADRVLVLKEGRLERADER
jgi:lipoprotein-releasing system ATP-binding protein